MSIKTVERDIFAEFKESTKVIMMHCANCQCIMGGGIARIVREKYPEVHQADMETQIGPKKLGTYSKARVLDGKHFIFNLYGQNDYTRTSLGDRDLSYDAIYMALKDAFEGIRKAGDYKVLIPYGMGSDLAGGRWPIVEKIIEVLAEDIEVTICRLPNKEDLV